MAFSSEVHRQRNQFRFATSSGRQIGYAYITTAVIPAIPLAGGFTNDPPIELEDINALTNTPTATFSSTLTAEKVKIKLSYIVGGSVTVTNVWDVAPDETSPGVHAMTFNTGESNADVQGWATTLHPLLGTQRVTITVSSDPELPTLYYGDKAADTLFYGGNEATAIYRGTTQIWPDVDTHIIDLDVVVTADTRPNVWDYVITWGVTGDSFTVGRSRWSSARTVQRGWKTRPSTSPTQPAAAATSITRTLPTGYVSAPRTLTAASSGVGQHSIRHRIEM